ncbi:MAG TPA: 2-oxoglutarate oxidoreductase [Clostridiales bacterium]|nr:2-oxoglutarate oxidoreductase [Clostridiales bacterium]
MSLVFQKTKGLTDKETHYCPGCTHGIIHRLIGEALSELNVLDKTVGVASVGCSGLCYFYFNSDMVSAAHGRAPAVATGIKRSRPDVFTFTYQGDGDLAAIGTAEIVQAAARGEKISTIFVNNAIYGMTGGQMAPTTLIGQRTSTSPNGRNEDEAGKPIRVSEMLATLDGVKFIERVSVDTPANIRKTKKAIINCFETQIEGKGFGLVEILSTCPTNWGMTAENSLKWLQDNMIPYYLLGNFKNWKEEA